MAGLRRKAGEKKYGQVDLEKAAFRSNKKERSESRKPGPALCGSGAMAG